MYCRSISCGSYYLPYFICKQGIVPYNHVILERQRGGTLETMNFDIIFMYSMCTISFYLSSVLTSYDVDSLVASFFQD